MKISVCNGSPRGNSSNSSVLIRWLNQGFNQDNSQQMNEPCEHILARVGEHQVMIDELATADKILIVFPLYTDAMPGVVMAFFEGMYGRKQELAQKDVLFVVHSGFSEGLHSYPVKGYLEGLKLRFDFKSVQVVIQGGSEGTRLMPDKMQKKKIAAYEQIAVAFKNGEPLPDGAIKLLEKPYQYSTLQILGIKLLNKTGLTNIYWNRTLKMNNAFDKRFDRPYLDKEV